MEMRRCGRACEKFEGVAFRRELALDGVETPQMLSRRCFSEARNSSIGQDIEALVLLGTLPEFLEKNCCSLLSLF